MKNKTALYASVIALCACFATPAISATTVECTKTCDGGKCFKGAVTGHEYCRSSTGMTWWAAFAWCKQQGRTLTTVQQACVDWDGATGTSACPNMANTQADIWVWTANPSGSDNAFSVSLTPGSIDNLGRNYHRYAALCY